MEFIAKANQLSTRKAKKQTSHKAALKPNQHSHTHTWE